MPLDYGVNGKAPAVIESHRLMYRPGAVRGGRGTLLVDNRASGGTLEELPTMTCAHCNCVVVLHPQRARERGHCTKCHAYICDKPGCRAGCSPTEAMVELAQQHPDQPWLLRGPQGEVLFDPALRDNERIH